MGLLVGAMTLPNLLERLYDGALLITPGDRIDVLLAALYAHASPALPAVAGIVLTGGLRPPAGCCVARRRRGDAAVSCTGARHVRDRRRWPARTRAGSPPARSARSTRRWRCSRPTSTARRCSAASRSPAPRAVTPLMFEYALLDRARAQRAAHRAARGRRTSASCAPRRRCCCAAWPSSRCSATRREVRGAAARLGVDVSRRAACSTPPTPRCATASPRSTRARRAHKGVTRRPGARRRDPAVLLRHADGRARDGRRDGVRRHAHDGGDDPARASS